ncbi:MAG: hypothetical protein QNJ72_09860 [Pleurocapsa sp. MO_226.B13]|nr:hypothetical protein [Pleurocapsa sp. MO_226.B13]
MAENRCALCLRTGRLNCGTKFRRQPQLGQIKAQIRTLERQIQAEKDVTSHSENLYRFVF